MVNVIQRTMLDLLNQLDGFDTRGNVKVTIYGDDESVEPALICPGRIYCKIEFQLPDVKGSLLVCCNPIAFCSVCLNNCPACRLHMSRMSLGEG